jgi:uncharacterized membrane protein YeaQ/YmgE (transglycosylase-associated protein family)
MYFALSLLLGLVIGVVACLPNPGKDPVGFLLSGALGTLGALGGWIASIAMKADTIGPAAQNLLLDRGLHVGRRALPDLHERAADVALA